MIGCHFEDNFLFFTFNILFIHLFYSYCRNNKLQPFMLIMVRSSGYLRLQEHVLLNNRHRVEWIVLHRSMSQRMCL